MAGNSSRDQDLRKVLLHVKCSYRHNRDTAQKENALAFPTVAGITRAFCHFKN
ncbi:MAG: hypothetical protein ABSB25_05185 [Sedimentisphaerales bacterium]|jgi:hypothetical protein